MNPYGGRHKTRAAMTIAKNAAGHVTDTKPETMWDEFCEYAGVSELNSKPRPLPIHDDESGDWTFKPDRFLAGVRQSYVHLDGPYHWTKRMRARDDWEDRMVLLRTDKHAFRVDSPLITTKRYWPDVLRALLYFKLERGPMPAGFVWTSENHRSARLHA